jgi:hypothetical protein
MYFRIDLDIDGLGTDVFEVFDHSSFNDPGGDGWKTINTQGKFVANPPTARMSRIRDLTSASQLGALRGYEIELPQNTGLDNYTCQPPRSGQRLTRRPQTHDSCDLSGLPVARSSRRPRPDSADRRNQCRRADRRASTGSG